AARKTLTRLLVRYGRHDDDVLTLLPVDGCCHLELRRELAGIQQPQHLVEIPTRAHRIHEHRLDELVGPDQVHRPHRLVVDGRATLGARAGVRRQHVVELRHREIAVAYQRIAYDAAG